MRILFFLSYYKPYIGGAENAFIRLAEGLARRGHDVTVITSRIPGTSIIEVINGVQVERVYVPKWGDRYFFPLFGFLRVMQKAAQTDLIHTASNCITIPAYFASKIYRRPIVFTSLEVLGKRWEMLCRPRWLSWFYQSIEKIIAKRSYDRCIAISEATQNDLESIGIDKANISVIHCGVDEEVSKYHSSMRNTIGNTLREHCDVPEDGFLYVYFGRPGATKGVEHLVRATTQIAKRIPNSRLALILGQKPESQYLSICQQIEQLELSSTVHLIPSASDRTKLFKMLLEADCIVVPSITEGFGLTTAEACALGVPVVASDVGSIPEVISGKHILVQPGSAESIAEAVIKIFEGNHDYLPPKEFSWTKMISDYEEIYAKLLTTMQQPYSVI